MSKGKLNIQAADGAVIGLVVPDGLTSGERQIALGANLSGITAYHLLQGNLAVSNSTITQGFNTTLYTSGTATTNIDSDTQWGNAPEERFGVLSILKDRIEATNLFWYDTVRGATKEVNSNTTEAEATLAGGLTAFNSTGFTVGADAGHNSTTNNMVSWNFQTTHRVSGTTNHSKAYTCHYNPFTGFTIVKYEGSGIAGHEIPHHLGRKLGFVTIKNLSSSQGWITGINTLKGAGFLQLNLTDAFTTQTDSIGNWFPTALNTETTICSGANNVVDNASSNQYIMYGWANSYFDESNKLIGNYELVAYQGTGAAGNKVKTKGKPAWVMIKRTDGTGNWYIVDNQRGLTSGNSNFLIANTAAIEASNSTLIEIFNPDGFTHNGTSTEINASGGQYIALVAYDTNANGGGSYYPLASDTANLQINNALIPFANGVDGNGAKNTILSKNETITGLNYTQGKNYVYCDKNGSYGVKNVAPVYTDTFSTETIGGVLKGDEFHITQNKWQTIANIPRGDLANPSLVNIFGDGSCKALYRFEGNANDESGTYNGTATNVVYGSNALIGQSAIIPTGAIFKSDIDMTTIVTVSGWINLKNDVANGMIWAFGGDSGANSIFLFCNGNGKYNLAQASYAGGVLVSVNTIQLNTWVHISTVITSTEYKLYINGVLDSVYNPTSAMGNLNIGFSIGGLYNSTYMNSSLISDQIRIFNRALSEAEVKSLYSLYAYTYDQTNSRNYLNHIVHADNDGGVLYVEELPKIEYRDIVKANEFRGKNACTALISFDGTTTPITIRDSYNVSAIIRVATGVFDIYFKEQMYNTGYSIAGTGQSYDVESLPLNRYLNKVQITTGVTASTRYNDAGTTVIIMGGKN